MKRDGLNGGIMTASRILCSDFFSFEPLDEKQSEFLKIFVTKKPKLVSCK